MSRSYLQRKEKEQLKQQQLHLALVQNQHALQYTTMGSNPNGGLANPMIGISHMQHPMGQQQQPVSYHSTTEGTPFPMFVLFFVFFFFFL